jgi:hypothetical protein
VPPHVFLLRRVLGLLGVSRSSACAWASARSCRVSSRTMSRLRRAHARRSDASGCRPARRAGRARGSLGFASFWLRTTSAPAARFRNRSCCGGRRLASHAPSRRPPPAVRHRCRSPRAWRSSTLAGRVILGVGRGFRSISSPPSTFLCAARPLQARSADARRQGESIATDGSNGASATRTLPVQQPHRRSGWRRS